MECVKELKQLMETAGFRLTKWSSNKPLVLRSLPEEDVVSESKAKMALGIVWDSKEDIIISPAVSVARPDQQMTKGGMLSVIMKIFDPLGYLSPFLVKAKWNRLEHSSPKEYMKDWQDWIADTSSIPEIRLPRCWLPAGADCIKELVMSKTRIVKRVTLPRLELMAALITARLISFVKTSLEMEFSKVVCWTDSQIALRWIQGDSYRWKPFVENRVESILELTDAQWWRHCPTADNPADILTRVCRLKDLLELVIDRNPELEAEVRKSARELHTQTKAEPVLDLQKCSSLMKLFNVTAYVFRFITNCKVAPEGRKTTPLDVREIDQAEKFWWKALQEEEFPEELESLKQEKKLPKSSRLLLVRDEHIRHLHAGVDQTLSNLCQRYWIANGRSVVKQVIKECVTCRKENAKPFLQKMSDLLRERVVEVLPFENTGLDIAGPLYAREGNFVRKVYICLFTCMTTRAIHLELVSSLAAQRFLQALDRFFARRGQPRIIQSDNFTSFKEIGRILNELVLETHRRLTSKRIEWKYITMVWRLMGTFGSVCEDSAEEGTGQNVTRREGVSHSTVRNRGTSRAPPHAPYDPNHHGQTTDTVGRLTRRWRYRKKLIAHFWKRWRSENIVSFCTQSKWRGDGTEPKAGDVVLIAEDDLNKGRWMMGRVLELFHGRDGVVRLVRLKEAKGEITRPTKKLRLLEPAVIDGVPSSSGEDVADSN
ncbi:hypothetical protein T4D_16120 [Trichinella pseudospiralis]|nr:hypothetical protein T4D_14746 [Trichinella pseudospiralis]KRY81766.1 hypothetical protein T4D_16120 [Trichinella pseudospiralis]